MNKSCEKSCEEIRQNIFGQVSALCGGFLLAVAVSQPALALPLPKPLEKAPASSRMTAEEITESGLDFTAIVALNNCSGSLIQFSSSRPEDKAMVLTNGHCYEGGFLKAGEVLSDKASSRSFDLLNARGNGKLATYKAEKLVYATMTNTDVGLYRLNTTFAAIKKATGVDALVLAESRPEAGFPIRIVSGYWKRIYSCNIKNFVPVLREGTWTFKDAIKYTKPGCEVIGGTSGSPLIHAETKEVVGVNNTTNESGQRCTVNNPCEVDNSGNVVVEKGAGYGQQTHHIYSCLTSDNTLDLNRQGCLLPKNALASGAGPQR